jgi:hypothetical protein
MGSINEMKLCFPALNGTFEAHSTRESGKWRSHQPISALVALSL